MSSETLDNFLRKRSVKKGDTCERTNLRIGDKSSNLLGGSFNIKDEDYDTFLDLYCNQILKKGKTEHLTEKQLESGGPFVIDLDFRYNIEVKTRLHNNDHIDNFVYALTNELNGMYQMDEDVCFKIFVMQKENVNPLVDKKLTKDGIHIMIGLKSDKYAALYLRNAILKKMEAIFEKIPLINTLDDVYDKGVASGSNQWQLFGSQKPNHQSYKIYKIYEVGYDQDDDECIVDECDINAFDVYENIKDLSVRNVNNPQLFMKSSFVGKYEAFKGAITGNPSTSSSSAGNSALSSHKIYGNERELFKMIASPEQLAVLVSSFLENINSENFELKEIHSYALGLPASYYGSGSYNNWIRVCWALHNTHERLLLSWIAFSAKAPNFCYSSIPELIEYWDGSDNNSQGLSKKSIIYWIKEDNPSEYKKIHKEHVSHYVSQIIYGVGGSSTNINDNDVSDDTFAAILFQLYKNDFICASVEKNIWYKFISNRWKKDDSGTSLRGKIQQIKSLLHDKLHDFDSLILNSCNNGEKDDSLEKNKKIQRRLLKIIMKIGNAPVKKNIMTEAKQLFYDSEFMGNLDSKPHLLAFNNGVIDFNEKIFRKGRPEDYISLSTNINYITLNESHAAITTAIQDFMRQIYPQADLYTYMWEHLASCMTGWNKMQTAQMYIGDGQNGKSAVIQLMSMVLGDYKYEVQPNLITDNRVKIGGTAPEIVQLKGRRMVCVLEPKKNDILNEGIFKQLTASNDPITARGLYQHEPLCFYPQFKLVIASNYLMNIHATDHGTWRRVRAVPHVSLFTDNPVQGDSEKPYQFKKDTDIGDIQFPIWKEVMASLLINIVYKTNGLVTDCDIVTSKSRDYQESQDSIAEFLRDKVVKKMGSRITKQDISSEFSIWYQQTYGRGGPSAKDLYEYMNKKFGRARNSMWKDIELVRGNRRVSESDSEDSDEGEEDECEDSDEIGIDEM
jgi:P4 family phage/plasmid primase-like protien